MTHSHATAALPPLKYRADIDGLRAIAVLAVVCYHAFPTYLSGGYVGVDIFFVISGFLISSIIFDGLDGGTFSFREFYAKRIRRIFPALIVVLTACYVAGATLLFADEFKQLGKHIGAGAGFIANLVLWSESGYFDGVAATKPLLHLWSLGIEEQFYFAWPVILFAVHRRGRLFLAVIATIIAASFAYNVWLMPRDPVAAFFSPLARFWELLCGAVLAYVAHRKSQGLASAASPMMPRWLALLSPGRLANLRSIVGLALIVTAIVTLSEASAFPGWWAILPTLGTFLCISAGPHAWLNRHLLSRKFLVFVGLISYPLYLWHWPLLTFAHILEAGTPSRAIRLSALSISLVAAGFTYQFVERYCRRPQRWMVAALCALLFLQGGAGVWVFTQNGLPSATRLARPEVERRDANDDACTRNFGGRPPFTYCKKSSDEPTSIAVIGDSHAPAIYYGLLKQYGAQQTILLAAETACPAVGSTDIYNTARPALKGHCARTYRELLPLLSAPSIRTVFLVGRGPNYLASGSYAIERAGAASPHEAFYQGLREVLRDLRGKSIILLLEHPRFDTKPYECARRFRLSDNCRTNIPRAQYDHEQAEYRTLLDRLSAEFPTVRLLDPSDFFCNRQECAPTIAGQVMFTDEHHLSRRGGEKLIEFFVGALKLKIPLPFNVPPV